MPQAHPQTTQPQSIEGRRRGLQPGQKHAGSFRRGYDPKRWNGGLRYANGMTLAEIARTHTAECVELLAKCVIDESQKMSDRIAASGMLLDRGWGKAVTVIDMNVNKRELASLSGEELEALARGDAPKVPITVEGDVVDADAQDSEEPVGLSLTAHATARPTTEDATC